MPDQLSRGLLHLPGEDAGAVRDARPGRGHLGAERARHRRRRIYPAVPATPTASARRCSSTRSTRTRRGLVACVFDGTDRVQHMFWRDIDHRQTGRSTSRSSKTCTAHGRSRRPRRWRSTPRRDALFVISDHGFNAFRRGLDLNAGCDENGYLTLEDGAAEGGSTSSGSTGAAPAPLPSGWRSSSTSRAKPQAWSRRRRGGRAEARGDREAVGPARSRDRRGRDPSGLRRRQSVSGPLQGCTPRT